MSKELKQIAEGNDPQTSDSSSDSFFFIYLKISPKLNWITILPFNLLITLLQW